MPIVENILLGVSVYIGLAFKQLSTESSNLIGLRIDVGWFNVTIEVDPMSSLTVLAVAKEKSQ